MPRTGTRATLAGPQAIRLVLSTEALADEFMFRIASGYATGLVCGAECQSWSIAEPLEKADNLNARGLPATQVTQPAIEEARKLGHKWPVRYR